MGFLLGLALSLATIFQGWRAYTGRWRTWIGYPGLLPRLRAYPMLGMLYGGIGLLAGTVLVEADTDSLPRPVLAVLMMIFLAGIWTLLISVVWLPRFMVPRWVEAAERANGLRP
ncbi:MULTISPECIES: hypothetical protein [Arthrobacter]|uniref:hypothetical protein n=1 Tax=Arthrobacter TaxID=1663 RepID=UPI0021032C70|nr:MULTISPECIES: hypothetical protein [Arthrobacter]MCQ1952640.1 hypothetical protein [Arthrobacter sp. zg-Y238]MCQ1955237.1 hypothetical protein [Arthrobacter jinronghuae]